MDEHPNEPREYKTVKKDTILTTDNNFSKTIKEMDYINQNKIEDKVITNNDTVSMPLPGHNPLHGPHYNYLIENKLDIVIAPVTDENNEEFNTYTMKPHSFMLSAFRTDTQSLQSNTIHVSAELVKKNVYFGKPTVYTNILTNQQVIDYVNQFNALRPEYIKVLEYDNHNEDPTIETTYYNPRINTVSLCDINVQEDETEHNKTIYFTISFDTMDNIYAR